MKLKDLRPDIILEKNLLAANPFNNLKPEIAKVAQAVYDEWDENEDEYAGGGICHLIADEIVSLLDQKGFESFSYNAQMEENHVYVIARGNDGFVYEIDIPPRVYETGAGYQWEKIPNVTIKPDDVIVHKIAEDDGKFEELAEF